MRNSNISRAMPPRHYWDSKRGFHFREDFLVAYTGLFTAIATGTGAGVGNQNLWSQATVLPANWIGITKFSSGTLSTNSAAIGCAQPIPLGLGPTWVESRIQLDALSDGTDTFTWRLGYMDGYNVEPTDGVYFRYTHGTNSGKFQAVTRSNGVETATDTGITAVATTDYILRIEVSADASSAKFYINGTLVATNTTNIPSGLTRFAGIGASLIKSLGTNNRMVSMDYYEADYIFTSDRA